MNMNSDSMKRCIYIIMLSLAAALSSCSKEWVSSIELGVNTDRVDIDNVYEGEFWFTVFAAEDSRWTLTVISGGEWLFPDMSEAYGRQHVRFSYTANMDDNARVARFVLKTDSGKEITVSAVQSGLEQSASDIDYIE